MINANFITGLLPQRTRVVGQQPLRGERYGSNTVGEYNATTGAAINANFITGLNGPDGLALSGNNLFVANVRSGTVGEYNATTGAAINANFITGLTDPTRTRRRVPSPAFDMVDDCSGRRDVAGITPGENTHRTRFDGVGEFRLTLTF